MVSRDLVLPGGQGSVLRGARQMLVMAGGAGGAQVAFSGAPVPTAPRNFLSAQRDEALPRLAPLEEGQAWEPRAGS